MRGEYDVEGDHYPRYSQKELDLQIEKAMETYRAGFQPEVGWHMLMAFSRSMAVSDAVMLT